MRWTRALRKFYFFRKNIYFLIKWTFLESEAKLDIVIEGF